MNWFSFKRFWAVVVKEFIQLRRDRITFAMMIGIPLIQLTIFGFAINADPKHLPTAILCQDKSAMARSVMAGIQNSSYFDITHTISSDAEGKKLLDESVVQFVISIPVNFSRDLIAGSKPVVLLEADATDPIAVGHVVGAFESIVLHSLHEDLKGPLLFLKQNPPPVDVRVHAKYNPEGITQYNIIPGLMGVILTLTLTIMTGLSITRERERSTMENLLSTPARPLEVMTGKIVPYILVGYIQLILIVAAARILFSVPEEGSLALVFMLSLVFIAANLAVGITFSTIARNQLQAMQLTFFFFLPSILLSGFMFPFYGMPRWAQTIGSILPLTHFLRLVRGVMLKGNTFADSWPHTWPMLLFLLAVILIGLSRYKRTLD